MLSKASGSSNSSRLIGVSLALSAFVVLGLAWVSLRAPLRAATPSGDDKTRQELAQLRAELNAMKRASEGQRAPRASPAATLENAAPTPEPLSAALAPRPPRDFASRAAEQKTRVES